ncbi:toxin-antitoxin system TumE family protein [Aquibacillus saliphilus]|uniref:toxin-antitoxin system TumE family protein n=1 Tax=Aquibacillus saliphilus TaxID=1909422 RepID=UPI001CF0CB46|nr:DUF6516 family protein [Aquibacillus saliphilus]
MSTGIPKTSFFFIEEEFEEIAEIRNGCVGLKNAPPGAIRKTILFNDMSKLTCQEFIKEDFIEFYHYDYYDGEGNIIMKFHSEPHEEKKDQTDTEPFHMHVATDIHDLKASKRIKNKHLQELFKIMVFIVNGENLQHTYVRQHTNTVIKKK